MANQNFTAEQREIIETMFHHASVGEFLEGMPHYVRDLKNLRPTPRPDLPRLEWPGDQKPAPAPALPEGWRLADHAHHGRVIVTRPEPDLDGEVAIAVPDQNTATRLRREWCRPEHLTYIDQEADQ